MLDLAGILLSSMMMLIVIVRAVRMDRSQPWFQTVKPRKVPAEKEAQRWRRER
jgi:hypothetical protein